MTDESSVVAWFSIEEVAHRCGVEESTVHELVVAGLVEVEPGETPRIRPETTLRVQRILRLQRDLGVNLEGVGVILDLLDRIEDLEAELKRLGRRR